VNASINDAIRNLAGLPPASTSNPVDPALAVTETNAAAAESASTQGDVSAAGDQPGQARPGRRASKALAANATIEELRAETERLRGEADEREANARADERARIAAEAAQSVDDRQFAETEARLQRLNSTPDAELSGEDYQWREDEKARRREYAERFPQVEAHYRQQADHRIQSTTNAFWADVRQQLSTSAHLPSVDKAALQTLPRWDQMAEKIHTDAWAGGAASVRTELQPEIDRLRAENNELKLTGPRGLGAAKTAINGGRSDSAPPVDENDVMNGLFRSLAAGAANR